MRPPVLDELLRMAHGLGCVVVMTYGEHGEQRLELAEDPRDG